MSDTRTVFNNYDVDVFTLTPDGGTLADYVGTLKSCSIKETNSLIESSGSCVRAKDYNAGKEGWSIDVTIQMDAGISSLLHAGQIVAVKCKNGIPNNTAYPYVRQGTAIVESREDKIVGGETDTQQVVMTLQGKGVLADVESGA